MDLLVIGGGVNGCGIARDAAGRGLSVLLAEKADLASATSSASTKLFHGGLRYLEYFEFGLVRKALAEREVLLRAMPHIAWPMRFVLPLSPAMRFEGDTPTSKLLGRVMPWARGRRPAWLIRAGLAMYDGLAGRGILPGTRTLHLQGTPEGAPLKPEFERAFEYSDCWIEDSRLVALNARDAAERGARIETRTRVASAAAEGGLWRATLEGPEGAREVRARMIVNAAGPWVADVISGALGLEPREKVRLVRGSHIVTRRLFDHGKCYFFQGEDGRIVFAIPYETDFTLIGTTDVEHPDPATPAVATREEQDYLRAFVSRYLTRPVERGDIVHTYSGVRPLYDDGAASATAATRDYVLSVSEAAGAPVLSVFGGKITTYRRLAEGAMGKIAPFFPGLPGDWTAGAPLPGGDFAVGGAPMLAAHLAEAHPFLDPAQALRLVRAYGTEAAELMSGAGARADLGRDFGAGLSEREVRWLMEREFARSAEDVVWRRSKLGLRLDAAQIGALDAFMREAAPARLAAE